LEGAVVHPGATHTGASLLVTPRVGMISPWSSKATDIARHCGLRHVVRLERGIQYQLGESGAADPAWSAVFPLLADPMTQSVHVGTLAEAAARLFQHAPVARPLQRVVATLEALAHVNGAWGLALAEDEMRYLVQFYQAAGRDATDVELMMFAQANSEHCRHKIFNASWTIDGAAQPHSLFAMIRNTHAKSPKGTLVAYKDNAAVMTGGAGQWFQPRQDGLYEFVRQPVHILMKVETHNHPTAISPFPGAATGAGGEIRDEGATGRGGYPKAGLVGFSVSNLRLPGGEQPWEKVYGKPGRIASALQIMLEGPIGAAAFNNEFGRPNLTGYFRTFEQEVAGEVRGYHKPIMIAGGLGNITASNLFKKPLSQGDLVIQLGGPAMLIGLGGGAASSQASGASHEELDFASVQRENAEMERRCQEVLNRCWQMGQDNPILSLHDVGAGGLSNAIPELLHDGGVGGELELRLVPNDDPAMSPMEIWCNESQERYVLAIAPASQALFEKMCRQERCPFAILGVATREPRLLVKDRQHDNTPIDMPMDILLGKPPRMERQVTSRTLQLPPLNTEHISLQEAAERVLSMPAVADKTFLITIGDRTVTGLVCRDQMVGPWQVPVADVAVTCRGYATFQGEAMAMGERTPVALLNGPAAARLAVAEAVTNMAAAHVGDISHIKLSANWMSPAGHGGEDANLYASVAAVGLELCPQLGIAIPVGKDSLSMKTVWQEQGVNKAVVAPLSLIISAFAPVKDVRRSLTPQLRTDCGETDLILVDLGNGRNRLGGSVLAQAWNQVGQEPADLDHPQQLRHFFQTIQELNRQDKILAYHDRSDGGLFVTLCEMAFAGHTGLWVELNGLGDDLLAVLFNEEPGGVLQVRRTDTPAVLQSLQGAGHVQVVGTLSAGDQLVFTLDGNTVLAESRVYFQRVWAETSWRMRALRDNPTCAHQEYDALLDNYDPGLNARLTFNPKRKPAMPAVVTRKPRVAILREQGVNGHVEMAAAFHTAGFDAVDVTMESLVQGANTLETCLGLAACGGFSFGDVLGAGRGWASSILHHPRLRDSFTAFFHRQDTFSLGVCNGCQMLSNLAQLIPGADWWPRFRRNRSEQFEARLSLVEILPSPSILLKGMEGSILPIAVAHGEGRAVFDDSHAPEAVLQDGLVSLRYVDNRHKPAVRYPANPNGSALGITGLTTTDGRVTIMMP
ncbi:MAG: phosphoribosylformylglycinamidine synthase, partial [Magnetococcales bacterium]|nr:phosphoribosylformylglycinamidine synthase [Magnetococcales bacterium]